VQQAYDIQTCGSNTPPPLLAPLDAPPTTPCCRVLSRSIASYKGNYDVFVKTAAERLRNAQKAAEAQAAKRAHVQVGWGGVGWPGACFWGGDCGGRVMDAGKHRWLNKYWQAHVY